MTRELSSNGADRSELPTQIHRRGIELAFAVSLFSAVACGSGNSNTDGAGTLTGSGGAAALTGSGGAGVAPGSGGATALIGSGGAVGVMSGGTPGVGGMAMGSGGSGAGGADPGAGGMDVGAGGMDVGAGGMAPMPTGPVPPDMLGPHEVILDQNVGAGFEVPIASSDVGDGVAGCSTFASLFGQDPTETADFIRIPDDLNMALYTLYRPAVLEEGKQYPLVTWGNGTCALPEGYGTLLRHVASHGILVVAAHSRQVGGNRAMTRALDWAFAANDDPASPYYQKFDTANVGAFGHSQGSGATRTAASDSRVKVVILFNGGSSASKPYLAITGDRDLGGSVASLRSAVDGSSQPAAWLWYHMIPGTGAFDGHLTLITEPSRVVGPTTAWFRMWLQGDDAVRSWFIGSDCELCNRDAEFEYGANQQLQ